MTFKISPIGLQKLLDAKRVIISGGDGRFECEIELDDNALAMVVDRRLPELVRATQDPIHGLHL